MDSDVIKTPANEAPAQQPRRRKRWSTLLVPLLALGSLLWVSNWFYQRSRLLNTGAVSHVVLGELQLPWGMLIGDDMARELFGAPVELHLREKSLTPYQMGIVGRYTGLKSLQLRGVTDADVRRLRGLTNLENLSLDEPQLTDEACEIIGRFDQLQHLSLGNYQDATTIPVTDQGLSHLVGLTQLQGLELPAPGVTDDGLKSIAKLPTLTGLALDGTNLSGEGLGDLSKLTNLQSLGIRNWSLKEYALSDLPKLGNFECLVLWNCSFSKNCLRPLGECSPLRQLSLTGPNVTDSILDDLTSIRSFRLLWLDDTKVSREACERFHEARPDVELLGEAGRLVRSQLEDR